MTNGLVGSRSENFSIFAYVDVIESLPIISWLLPVNCSALLNLLFNFLAFQIFCSLDFLIFLSFSSSSQRSEAEKLFSASDESDFSELTEAERIRARRRSYNENKKDSADTRNLSQTLFSCLKICSVRGLRDALSGSAEESEKLNLTALNDRGGERSWCVCEKCFWGTFRSFVKKYLRYEPSWGHDQKIGRPDNGKSTAFLVNRI